MIKRILNKRIENFLYFYSFLKYRIVVSLGLSFLVGLLDGLTLTMLIPMLQIANGNTVDESGRDLTENVQFIVDGFESLNLDMNLSNVLLVMFLLFCSKGLARFVEVYINAKFQQYFLNTLRSKNVNDLAAYGYKAFVTQDAGRIQNTLTAETERVNSAYHMYIEILQKTALVIVYISMAYATNPKFALMVSIGGLMTNFIYKTIYKSTKRLSKLRTERNHTLQGLVIQLAGFFKYLKATGLITGFSAKLNRLIVEIEKIHFKLGFLSAMLLASREPLVMGVVLLSIYLEVNFMGGSLELIILSLLFFYRSLTYITMLQSLYNKFLGNSGSLENMKEFGLEMAQNKEIQGSKHFDKFKRNLELEGVSFSYDEKDVLKNIDLEIDRLQSIAFVGESGSGKTTLMNLLAGLILPGKGTLKVDGTNINEFDRRGYQNRIGYITQEPVIFDDTVFNNVTFWDEMTPQNIERFWIAVEKAAVKNFIESLDQQELAPLGNSGIMVSGGQKQRISIAREFYKDIDILLLDEATSALDSETELIIKESLDRIKGQYTIITIAHRLATVKDVDIIYFMEDGKIEASGDFKTLVENSPKFAKMATLQEV